MSFGLEIGFWAGVALLGFLLCRGRLKLACLAGGAGFLMTMPLIVLANTPEDSVWAAELLSREWIGAVFGAVGGLVTGSALAATLCLPKDRNRRIALPLFIFTGLSIAVGNRKSEIFHPFTPSGQDSWDYEVCLQTTGATCGPASLATCLRILGMSATESDLARDANTSQEGTFFADLARVARHRGATAVFHAHQSPDAVPLPAIASVILPGGENHFIALISKDGSLVVADPLNGSHSFANGKSLYQWTGTFLSLSKDK